MSGNGFFVVYYRMKLSLGLLGAAIAVGFTGASALAGAGATASGGFYSRASAPLVVKRSPNIGYQQHFNLYIDGVRVASLGYGRTYEGVVATGLHLVTVKQMPHLNDAWPYSQQWIRVLPGRTNVFTATWRDGGTRIRLEGS